MTESTFRTKLNSILKDNAIERYVGNKKRGKINTKRLYKIADSKKIFKQKEERKGKDYSITLLLDASGSMSGERDIVAKSVAHIGNALNSSDIPFSIYSFSDITRLIKTFEEKYDEEHVTELYDKTFTEYYYYCYSCHQYDVPVPENKRGRYHIPCPTCGADLEESSSGGTNDALALHIVGNEVHKAYKKNILIVITDGSGDNLDGSDFKYGKVNLSDLKNNRTVINKLHKKYEGLILLGISIGGNFTSQVYGRQYSDNIAKPNQIFDSVAKLLSRHIRRG